MDSQRGHRLSLRCNFCKRPLGIFYVQKSVSCPAKLVILKGSVHKTKKRTGKARDCISEAIKLFEKCEADVLLTQAKAALASLEQMPAPLRLESMSRAFRNCPNTNAYCYCSALPKAQNFQVLQIQSAMAPLNRWVTICNMKNPWSLS